jgi:hypothetical protein
LAATTLLAAGLLVSTFDFVDLLLVGVAVFLLTRDFFSIAILASPGFDLSALRFALEQAEGQTPRAHAAIFKSLKTTESKTIVCQPCRRFGV